jgi:hypothetical protein
VSKGNQAVTSNGQLALVKQVALFSAIVTYKIGGWLKHEMVERLVFKCVQVGMQKYVGLFTISFLNCILIFGLCINVSSMEKLRDYCKQ